MRLTKQYAYGLLASISEESSIDVLFQLQELTRILKENEQYMHALDVQVEDFQQLRAILNGEFDPMVINFLEVITEEGMLYRLDTITEDYHLVVIEENILFDVLVYSDRPLTEPLKRQLQDLVQQRYVQNLTIYYLIHKQLIGGI